MRKFLFAVVATAALVAVTPCQASAQIIVQNGTPMFAAPTYSYGSSSYYSPGYSSYSYSPYSYGSTQSYSYPQACNLPITGRTVILFCARARARARARSRARAPRARARS